MNDAAWREKRLKRRQHASLRPNGPHRHHIVRLVQLRPGEELLVAGGFDLRVFQTQAA